MELFLLPDGTLVVNELAPRVHNSGHATIEARATSQFEQHIRAICGLPLGDPDAHGPPRWSTSSATARAAAARLVGAADALADPRSTSTVRQARVFERRKMGHLTRGRGGTGRGRPRRGRAAHAHLRWAEPGPDRATKRPHP